MGSNERTEGYWGFLKRMEHLSLRGLRLQPKMLQPKCHAHCHFREGTAWPINSQLPLGSPVTPAVTRLTVQWKGPGVHFTCWAVIGTNVVLTPTELRARAKMDSSDVARQSPSNVTQISGHKLYCREVDLKEPTNDERVTSDLPQPRLRQQLHFPLERPQITSALCVVNCTVCSGTPPSSPLALVQVDVPFGSAVEESTFSDRHPVPHRVSGECSGGRVLLLAQTPSSSAAILCSSDSSHGGKTVSKEESGRLDSALPPQYCRSRTKAAPGPTCTNHREPDSDVTRSI
ncbi:hypothetical protein SKAU_G00308130 [Synaphobranchus kaupii]|uniref:Uncharacterized protein n=1 Tax=Synaphobranchus kaupii TaxID=118154 RepID=A0A9Q1ERC3_SYNKA|nr:hypothetical protein SKAU_G00308130 [Synaphobranchus kaupii]